MSVIFPHANNFAIDDCEFLAALELWFERFQPNLISRTADHETIPRLNAAEILAIQLQRNRRFSLDVLCRILVRPAYRNTMQATNIFMNKNAHLLEPVLAENPASSQRRLVNSARLTGKGKEMMQICKQDENKWYALKTRIEACIDADIQLEEKKHEDNLLTQPLAESIDTVNNDAPQVQINCCDDLIRALVFWIENAPFQPMYRGKPYGGTVKGWRNRLNSYFWPKPKANYLSTLVSLQTLETDAQNLANSISKGVNSDVNSVDWANSVFTWGGVPQNNFTSIDVNNVISCAIGNVPPDIHIPMNSGWTKIASFATAHLEVANRSLVIWDSRVAHSLIRRMDTLLFNSGYKTIPAYLQNIGIIPGRAGTRTNAKYNLTWPNGYKSWSTIFAGSNLVRKIRDELNHQKIGATNDKGEYVNWTVRTVEMVLFMDGY